MLDSQDFLLEMVWKALKVEMFMFMLASIHVFGGTFRFNVSRILRLIEIGWCHICHLFEVEKELVSGFGKKDLCVVKHGITGRFAITCASWSQGPRHGVTS